MAKDVIAQACMLNSTREVLSFSWRLAQREDVSVIWYNYTTKEILKSAPKPDLTGEEQAVRLGGKPITSRPPIATSDEDVMTPVEIAIRDQSSRKGPKKAKADPAPQTPESVPPQIQSVAPVINFDGLVPMGE